MTEINKIDFKKLAGIGALTLGLMAAVGAYSISTVSADEIGQYPPFVQRLAERFGLDQGEVEQFFEEEQDIRHEEMQAQHDEKLDELVSDGTITEEQRALIEAQHEQMQTRMEEIKDLDPSERQAAMEQLHEENQQWAEDNGIDMPLLGGPRGGHMMGGADRHPGMHGGFGEFGPEGLDDAPPLAN